MYIISEWNVKFTLGKKWNQIFALGVLSRAALYVLFLYSIFEAWCLYNVVILLCIVFKPDEKFSDSCFPQVPTKKLKKFEKEYQSLRESQLQQEDPIDRYQVRRSLFNLYLLWSSSSPPAFIFISLCLSSGLCNGPHWKPQTLSDREKDIVDACFVRLLFYTK